MRSTSEVERVVLLAAMGVVLGVVWMTSSVLWGILLWGVVAVLAFVIPQMKNTAAARAAQRAEIERLERTQETARSVLNSLPHAVALVSPEGQIEILNAQAARLGLKAGEHVARSSLKWLPALVREVRETRGAARSQVNGAFLQVFEGGKELFFLPQANPVINDRGELIGITVLLMDMTDAREINEAKSGLLSTVSHQLKTPLTSMQMSIHLLLEDAADRLTPRQMELLRTAAEDSERLRREIEELLSAARGAASGRQ